MAYLDDDTVPETGWRSGLAEEFRDPLMMGVSGKTVPLEVETEAERQGLLLDTPMKGAW